MAVQPAVPFLIDERNNNTRLDPDNIDHKILIYEREVQDWFINRASKLVKLEGNNYKTWFINHLRKLVNGEDNGFIVLMICMSYIEGVEQYKEGQSSNRQSKIMFKQSLEKIYPNLYSDDNLERLYNQSRVGLFHNGMVRGDIIINDSFPSSLSFENEDIKINPRKLLLDIKNDFNNYIMELRNTENIVLRNKFNQMFSVT